MKSPLLAGLTIGFMLAPAASAQEGGGLPSEPPQVPGQNRSARDASTLGRVAGWIGDKGGSAGRAIASWRAGELLSDHELEDAVQWAVENYGGPISSSHGEALLDVFGPRGANDLKTFLIDPGNVVPRRRYDPFVTGKEWALKKAVEDYGRGQQLNLRELLLLSLRLNKGDVYKALLTAHNMLRGEARGYDQRLRDQIPAAQRKDDDSFARPGGNEGWFDTHLIRLTPGDNSGAWYHMFGTAVAAMVVPAGVVKVGTLLEEGFLSHEEDDGIEYFYDTQGADMASFFERELLKSQARALAQRARKGIVDRLRGRQQVGKDRPAAHEAQRVGAQAFPPHDPLALLQLEGRNREEPGLAHGR